MDCELYFGRRKIGSLFWEQCGNLLRLSAACSYEPDWIYRLVLQTDRGIRNLGVMMPEGDRFLLRCTIPAGEVPQAAFADRTRPEEVHLPGLPLAFSAFGQPESEEIPALRNGALSARWMEDDYVLFPFCFGEKNEFAELFTIASVLEQENRLYGAFRMRKGKYLPL